MIDGKRWRQPVLRLFCFKERLGRNRSLYHGKTAISIKNAAMAAKRTAQKNASRAKAKANRKGAKSTRGTARSKAKGLACPIVGIGGSAGGFEAAMELLQNLPPSTGMAFVIVQHLDPHHASRLPSLLGKMSAMPVSEIAGTTTPKPNTVYVQPSNKCVIAKDGALTLIGRTERLNVAIDHWLCRSCSSAARNRARDPAHCRSSLHSPATKRSRENRKSSLSAGG